MQKLIKSLVKGVNGELWQDWPEYPYQLYNQLSPFQGNYCLRLELCDDYGTVVMQPINHDVRNGGTHGVADYMFFFVYLVFSHPISTWHDSPYANTGVRVNKNVPFSLRQSYDNYKNTSFVEPIGQKLTGKI